MKSLIKCGTVALTLGILMSSLVSDANLGDNLQKAFQESGSAGSWTPGICVREFPAEIRKDFPSYFAGYDFENRPVVFWEGGRAKYQKWADHNETTRELSYAYAEHFWCRIHNLTSPLEGAEDGIILVMDAADFDNKQFLSLEVNKLHMFNMRLAEKSGDNIADFIVINANFVANVWLNLVRPVAGQLMGRLDSYGTRKEKWLPVLRGKMENSVIPPWLTGEKGRKNFKPLQF